MERTFDSSFVKKSKHSLRQDPLEAIGPLHIMSYLFWSGDTLGITQSRGSLSSVLFLQDQVVVVLSSVVVGWKLSPLLFRTFGYVRKMYQGHLWASTPMDGFENLSNCACQS